MPDTFNRNRARLSIMNYVLSFCITYQGVDGRRTASTQGFISTWSDTPAQVGDLVILQSVGPSKWQIGWLIEIIQHPHDKAYCIESLEDGSLCNWTNVGISYMPRDVVDSHPRWRWTDQQYAFSKRWHKACVHQDEGQVFMEPVFYPDGSVTLRTRTRWSQPQELSQRNFSNWKKVTIPIMKECYEGIVAAILASKKEAAESL